MRKKKHSDAVRLIKAAALFLARQARNVHPAGTWDKGGRWEPTGDERCECCDQIRRPSKTWPNALIRHCRTSKHIARLFEVPEKDLRQTATVLRELLDLKDTPETAGPQAEPLNRTFMHLDMEAVHEN